MTHTIVPDITAPGAYDDAVKGVNSADLALLSRDSISPGTTMAKAVKISVPRTPLCHVSGFTSSSEGITYKNKHDQYQSIS